MYQDFFNFTEPPFAIVPNPKFFFLSERHKEALSHMLSGISGGGGMALLTGEVGTGKTMTMRALLARLPLQSQVLTIVNPSLTEIELLQTICDGFELTYRQNDSFKSLLDIITDKLYENEAKGIDSILLIDEAQHLNPEVLELLRLLTNIETSEQKLLKVILIGQPELHQLLRQENLRQLAQRITERYQLMPLPEDELKQYIQHRLTCAGRLDPVFNEGCYSILSYRTKGFPRLINLVCDESLKIAYREGKRYVSIDMVKQACNHVLEWQVKQEKPAKNDSKYKPYAVGAIAGITAVTFTVTLVFLTQSILSTSSSTQAKVAKILAEPLVIEKPKEKEIDSTSSAQIPPPLVKPDTSVLKEPDNILKEPDSNVKTISFSAIAGQSFSMGGAVQNLYQQWGYSADEEASSCRIETRADLSCYRGAMQFDQLININRPAILVMNGTEGRIWYALLYAINDEQIELVAGRNKQHLLVGREFIDQHWSGEVMLLWRPPFGNINMLSMGQRNARVRWLDDRLNMALGESNEAKNHFDQYVKNKLIAFQLQQNIDADGIAGPLTIMMLDGVLGLAGPTLKQSVAANAEEKSLIEDGEIVIAAKIESIDISLRSLPPYALSGEPKLTKTVKKIPPKVKEFVRETNKITEIKPANAELALGNEVFDINGLDLSSMSPLLAKQVEKALIQVAKTSEITESEPENQNYSNVINIKDLPSTILSKLPTMDFQAHIYASDPANRWVKVNNQNILEGQSIAGTVLLRGVEPNQVVIQFEDTLIAIPALSTW